MGHIGDARVGGEFYKDEAHKIELEARNGLLQFDEVMRLVDRSGGKLRLTRRKIERLHRSAIDGIYACAGKFRGWPVAIKGSLHTPPGYRYVPGLVAEMCRTANENAEWMPTKTAAYLLWRLNWIHPFGGGNGRTARALAYFALCVRLGFKLPGKLTIAEQIVGERGRYQDALEDADAAWKENVLDVGKINSLMDDLLERQLEYLDEEQTEMP